MSKLRLHGTSSGYTDIAPTAAAGNNTLTAPTGTGTIALQGSALSGTTGTFTGDVDIADKIVHTGDTNTAIRFPSADTITAETAGSQRLIIDSSGNIGIDQSTPSAYGKFVVNGTGNIISLRSSSGAGSLAFFEGGTGRFYIKTLNGSDGLAFVDADNSSERLRIDSSGHFNITGITTSAAFIPSGTEQQFSHRNIWINGDARIAQKGTSIASLSSAGGYVAGGPDRTYVSVGNHGTWTLAQGTDAPPGFKNCVQWTATTGDASVASNAAVRWWQRWEGQDMQRFCKGTSSAKEFALSFWVKSSTTGDYAIELLDYDNSNRGVTRTYTINAADTWEHKNVILPADTTGTFDNDNVASFACEFWLVAGSDYTSGGADASWHAYVDNKRAGGHTANAGASNSDYHRVTGIQLEAGSYCTPYEHKSIAQELRACQRYFCKSYPFNTAPGTDTATDICSWRNQMSAGRTDMTLNIAFPVPMRVTPTITGYSKNGNSNKYLESGIDYSGGNEGNFAGTVYAGRKYFTQLSSGNTVDSGNYAHFHFTAAAEV